MDLIEKMEFLKQVELFSELKEEKVIETTTDECGE